MKFKETGFTHKILEKEKFLMMSIRITYICAYTYIYMIYTYMIYILCFDFSKWVTQMFVECVNLPAPVQ